jgi:hypothetical protein
MVKTMKKNQHKETTKKILKKRPTSLFEYHIKQTTLDMGKR